MILYLASTNAGKLAELRALFADEPGISFEAPPFLPDVEETGATFAENALIKAKACALALGAPCLADDSGLAVDALDGRPGVYSARYAENDEARNQKLLGELRGVPEARRGAAFVCALAIAWPDGRTIEVEGCCEGTITTAPRGLGGFGYDPVFCIPEKGLTFAELSPEEKNALSHRGRAMRALKERLNGAG